jgi:hypothetical protein
MDFWFLIGSFIILSMNDVYIMPTYVLLPISCVDFCWNIVTCWQYFKDYTQIHLMDNNCWKTKQWFLLFCSLDFMFWFFIYIPCLCNHFFLNSFGCMYFIHDKWVHSFIHGCKILMNIWMTSNGWMSFIHSWIVFVCTLKFMNVIQYRDDFHLCY